MTHRWTRICIGLLGALTAMSAVPAAAANFHVSYEAPGIQNSTASFSSYGVETFDTAVVGNDQNLTSSFNGSGITGTYTDVDIRSADQYGGSGGNTNFASTGTVAGYSLTLSKGVNYFGFWLSALDSGNNLTFYDGNTKVFSFSAGDVAKLLGAGYGGNPNAAFLGQDSGEDFAFLNFFDKTGTFDKIIFSESPQIGAYESDNHTIGFFTGESGTPVPVSGVPEPAVWMTMIGGLGLVGAMMRRTRRGGSFYSKTRIV
jgi:hypothetical protein